MRETLSVRLALQDSDAEAGTFKGMASVFGNLINAYVPTRISPGAFTKTLQENARRIRILYQHNDHMPIGKPTVLKETPDGLYFEAKISQTTIGKDCIILMRDGVIDETSIGFDPIKTEMVVEDGLGPVRHIKELRLWEISPVTFAADDKAKIHSIHSLQDILAVKPGDMPEDTLNQLRSHLGITVTAEALLDQAAALSLEQFEGKVLSAANRTLIQNAIEALNKIIDAAEPKNDSSLTVAFAQSRAMELELNFRSALRK